MGKRHHFIESSDKFGEFHRVIYCIACGLVIWNWNANHSTKPARAEYQEKVGTPCIDEAPLASQEGQPVINKEKENVN